MMTLSVYKTDSKCLVSKMQVLSEMTSGFICWKMTNLLLNENVWELNIWNLLLKFWCELSCRNSNRLAYIYVYQALSASLIKLQQYIIYCHLWYSKKGNVSKKLTFLWSLSDSSYDGRMFEQLRMEANICYCSNHFWI